MPEIRVTTVNADGTVTESSFDPGEDFWEMQSAAQEYWAELKAAGTPYWCIHENRSVSHPAAYWQDDQPAGADVIHRKHGVRCSECGGYIQEG